MKNCTKCNKPKTTFNILKDIDNSLIKLMIEKFIMNQLESVDAFVITDLHNKIFGSLTMSYDSLPIEEQIEKMVRDLIKYLKNIKHL